MSDFVKTIGNVVLAAGLLGLVGCSHAPSQPDLELQNAAVGAEASDASHSTVLLVSRSDGSIVRQTLQLDADICVKALENSTTTCLTQGEAVVNQQGIVVGYEMIAETIELRSAD